MPDYDTGEDTQGFIVDGVLGHHIWNKVNSSARVRFSDGVAILTRIEPKFGDIENLVRMAGMEYEQADDWAKPFSIAQLEHRMAASFSFTLDYQQSDIEEIRMGVYAGGTNGALFTSEYYQKNGGKARALIRIPVPQELKQEADGLASQFPDSRISRTQVGGFNERFAINEDQKRPWNYYVPHLERENITDRDDIIEMFDTALELVERGVRMSE